MRHVREEDLYVVSEYFQLLLEAMESQGISASSLLEGLAYKESWLKETQAHVPWPVCAEVARRALRLSGNSALGLLIGPRMTLQTHGFLGYAAMSSATLGDALDLAMKYFRTRTTVLEFRYFVEGETAVIQFDEVIPLKELLPFAIESLYASFHAMGQALLGDKQVQGEARVTYGPTPHAGLLEQFNGSPLFYECAANQLRFPVSQLALPLNFADPRLARMAEAQLASQMEQERPFRGILGQVRRIILADIANAKLERVADQLHMSSRSLKRKLAQLDTGFQLELDGVRKGVAVELLTQTNKTVDEIAQVLGYSDPSNFGRAFRKWTGKSPSDYRRGARQ